MPYNLGIAFYLDMNVCKSSSTDFTSDKQEKSSGATVANLLEASLLKIYY